MVKRKRLTPGMIAALVIAFFTLAAGVIISRTVFERLPHLEDEYAYLYQAKIFAGGHVYVVRNEPVAYLWQPFVLQPDAGDDGIQKRFGKYTPGWPLLLSVGVLLGEPWFINPILAMLSVLVVYRLGKEIFDEPVGLVSALLLAICPTALLLNATIMSHTPAMFMGVVFVYAYWRLTRNGKGRYRWATLAGLALGLMVATRPLSAVAIAVPVILHALSRVLDTMSGKNWFPKLRLTLLPLLTLSIFVLPTVATWAAYNQITTGDWKTDTYLMLWSYDKPGFGTGYGLMDGGHTLAYGFRNARADMEVYLRDLFGWTIHPAAADYLNSNVGWGAGTGLSWLVIVIGLVAGRKQEWIWLFFLLFVALVIAQMTYWIGSVVYGTAAYSTRYWYEATFGMCLVGGYGIVAWARSIRGSAYWLLSLVLIAIFFVAVIAYGVIIAYAVVAAAVIYMVYSALRRSPGGGRKTAIVEAGGGLPAIPASDSPDTPEVEHFGNAPSIPVHINYLNGIESPKAHKNRPNTATFLGRLQAAWDSLWPGYIILELAVMASLIGYTPARFQEPAAGWPNGLFRYNEVGQQQVQQIDDMRAKYGKPDQKVLIVVLHSPDPTKGDDWRDYGAAMAMTSPYLDSDIIVARVFDSEEAPDFVKRFPDRLVLYQIGQTMAPTIDQVIQKATMSTPPREFVEQ